MAQKLSPFCLTKFWPSFKMPKPTCMTSGKLHKYFILNISINFIIVNYKTSGVILWLSITLTHPLELYRSNKTMSQWCHQKISKLIKLILFSTSTANQFRHFNKWGYQKSGLTLWTILHVINHQTFSEISLKTISSFGIMLNYWYSLLLVIMTSHTIK